MKIPPFEPAHRDESNGGIPILLQPLDAEIFEWRRDKNADLMTFRRISRRPVFVEEWEYHHSNRLVEASRMVVFPFFYDHWTQRYLTKRYQIGVFITFGTAPFDVSSNISASSVRRRMGIPPFDSPRRAGSNGGILILLQTLDAEIFDKTSNGAVPKVIKRPI